ncbi:MAG: DUF262 domain-containing protein [Crenarchaeota archaeon]|nr:DUF262 domain-containing protein [Thermoproteota archaeon]
MRRISSSRSRVRVGTIGKLLRETENILEPSRSVRVRYKAVEVDIETLYSWLEKGEIVIDPELQRGYVWDNTKATYFFDSIIRGFPIPPIVLLANRDGKYLVLDGVQRLSTIKKIINNEITFTAIRGYESKRFTDLSEDVRRSFLRSRLTYYSVEIEAPNEEEYIRTVCSIVRRLNVGQVRMTLTQTLLLTARTETVKLITRIARSRIFLELAQPTEMERNILHDKNILMMLAASIIADRPLNLGYLGKVRNFTYIVKFLFYNGDLKQLENDIVGTLELCREAGFERSDFLLKTYGRRGIARIHFLPWTHITFLIFALWYTIDEEDFDKIREILRKNSRIIKDIVHEHIRNIPDNEYSRILRGDQTTFEKHFNMLYEKVRKKLEENSVKFIEEKHTETRSVTVS